MSTEQGWLLNAWIALSSCYLLSINFSLNSEFIYFLRYIHQKRYPGFEQLTEQVHFNDVLSVSSYIGIAAFFLLGYA